MKTCKAMPPIQNNLWGEHITNAMQSSHVIHLAPKDVGWEHYNIIFITATWSMKQNFSKGFKKKAVEKVKQNCETVSQRTFTQNLSEINVTLCNFIITKIIKETYSSYCIKKGSCF